jgi:predicted acyltransferase
LSRAAGLVVLGLILANAEKGDAQRMGMDNNLWALMGLSGGILFWLVPGRNPQKAWVFKILRYLGLALLIATYAIFRSSTGWIDGSYPEILGLIGYTYLAASILYLATRRWAWAPLAWFLILTASCAALTAFHTHIPLPLYIWPFDTGAMASITMAGVVVSTIFFGSHRWQSVRTRTIAAIAFGVVTIVAARLLTPLGISKIRATPTWCLFSAGSATLIFALLYWLCDVLKKRQWAAFVHPAGENTLMTYLLPDIYDFLSAVLGFTYLDTHFHAGAEGVVRALVFTLLILAISGVLTRLRIRLQL